MADGNSRSDLPLDGSCPGTFSAFHQSHAAVGSLSRDLPLPRSSSVLNYALQTEASVGLLAESVVSFYASIWQNSNTSAAPYDNTSGTFYRSLFQPP